MTELRRRLLALRLHVDPSIVEDLEHAILAAHKRSLPKALHKSKYRQGLKPSERSVFDKGAQYAIDECEANFEREVKGEHD